MTAPGSAVSGGTEERSLGELMGALSQDLATLVRKELELADRPFAEELKGDVEIKSATVTYRRKPAAK